MRCVSSLPGAMASSARNLRVRLRELGHQDLTRITRASTAAEFSAALADADIVFHLAGVNRPTRRRRIHSRQCGSHCSAVCCACRIGRAALRSCTPRRRRLRSTIPMAAASSPPRKCCCVTVARPGRRCTFFVCTNVFGKWCRPNYNSAVATFCHQIARGLPITVNDASSALRLVYVDDVVDAFVELSAAAGPSGYLEAGPVYETTVGELVGTLQEFADSRTPSWSARVGSGFRRALYATYVSHLPLERFAYQVAVLR